MRVSACVAYRLFASFFTLTCFVAIGCGGGHKTSSSYSIAISVTSGTIAVGTTNQLHATETNAAGISVDVTRSVSWSSSNTAIATVSSTGLLTGVGMGTATISANLNSTTGTQAVTIAAAAVSKLAISPAGVSLFTGRTQQFSVTATYSDGSTGDLTNSATWSVTPESVATISSAGLLTAVGAGSFTVTAASGSVTATASGIVSAPEVTSIAISPANATLAFGGTQQFTAVANYSDGSSASVTSAVTWSVTPASVARISPSGLLKAVGAGSFAVTATSGVVTGAVAGVVKNATLTSIAVSPTSTTLAAGSAQQYTATATYSDGSRVSLTNSASWSVTPSSVATINSSGLLMAVGAGSFSVTAATGSATGSAAGTVTSATLKSISISPASAVLFNGATQQYTATGTYSDGSVGNVSSSTTWSVLPSSVATISTGGLLTTVGAGSFTVTATSGSAMGGSVVSSATGTVSSPTLTSISVSPATVTLAKGATQQYTATGTYNDQSTKDLTASVTWSSDNATALAVDAAGLATAGTVSASTMVTISAQSGTLTGSATATVTASAMMTSMEVRPTSSSIASGTAEAHTALAFYSDGTQKDVSNLATWSVTPSSLSVPSGRDLRRAAATSGKMRLRANDSGSDVLTVDQDGVDYANQAGAANVQASLGSLQAASVVLVTAATVNLIGITSPALVLPVSAKQQFTLNGWFTDGSTQDLSLTANWQSSDSSIASVDSKGVVTAIRAGTFKVTANFGGLTATKVAQVVAADLVGTTIRAEYPVVGKGASEQLAVVGTFSDGSIQDLTPLATWSSSNSAVVSVDSAGFLQAIAAGRIQVAATVNGVSSEITILVADADIASFQVLPVNPSFALGTSLQFTALAAFTNGGQADLSDAVEWVSSDPTVLTINSQGLAKSFGVGTTTVTASLGGVSQISSVITVTSATITAMQLSPTSATIAKTTHQQYRATGWFSDGSIEDLDNDVAWSTSDAAIASVDNDGTVLGLQPGTAMVSALFSGISVSVPLTVTDATLVSTVLAPGNTELPVGMQLPFTLMGNFSDGSTQDLSADAIWQSPTPSIVFATATGSGVGLSPGIGTLSAVLGNFSSSTQVNVTDASLTGIALSPVAPVIRVGGSQQMVATGTFSDGYQQSLYLNAVFHADNNKIVNIGAAALAVGTAVGTTQITATFRGMTASTTSFTVQSGTLTSITLGPSNPTVDSGGSEQLTATGVYADGTTGDLTGKVSWTSSDPSVLAIDSNGVATAYAVTTATTVTVTATLGSITQSFNVTISPANGANVTALTITPMHATVAPGATQQYVAMATYADGQTRDVSTSVSWSSSNLLAAAISSNGLATGVATGITRIRGQIDGMWTSVPLTVSPVTQPGATVTSISVTPSIAAISAGATEQFTARASFSDGSLQDVTNTATWSSSNASAATVNSSGLATGVAAGASTIGATFTGVTGSAILTVSAATTKTLTAIVVTPTSSHVVAGLSQQLTATGSYSDGSMQDLTSMVTWSSSDPTIATVNGDGLVDGVGAGTALITAALGSQQSEAIVIVTAATLTSAAISPSGVSLAAGDQQQLTLTGTFSDGSRQDITSSATWVSLAPTKASVSLTGLVTALTPGSAQIQATYGGQTISTTVQVTSATLVSIALSPQTVSFAKGTTQQFTVTGTYSDGSTRDLTSSSTFASTDPAVATINSAGVATGVGAGSIEISVSVNGKTASTQTVTVTPATLVSVAITPSTPTFAEGTTQQFTATGTFSDGSTQDLSSQVVWASSNPQTATISNTGLATGGTPGSTQISATFNGMTSTTGTVLVTPATLTGLSVTPTTAQIAKGTTRQFTATGTYSDGTTQDLSSTVTWSSSNGSVASVNSSGLATGNGVGSAQISATFGGQTASTASFAVTPASLVSISFTPPNPTVAAGTSTQVTVTGTFSDGTTQDLSSSASYNTSNPAAVTVNSTGVVTGVAPGTSTVTVSVNGVTRTFTATVTNATLVSISITPNPAPNFAKGTTQQFTATGNYSDGSTQDLTSTVTWTSSNPALFTIDAHGLATGVGTGSASVTAAYQGQMTTTPPVQVTPAVAASIAVTPAGASVTIAGTQQYIATVTYTDATTLDVSSSATWSSSNATVASISSSGLALGVSSGSTTITGQYNGLSASTGLTVVPVVAPTLNSIIVTPSSASVANGNTQQFVATGEYSDGSMQNLTNSVTWQSSAPMVASIDSNGLATALASGNTQIWAASGSVSGVATLTVSPGTLVSLSVKPSTVTLAKGTSQQYTATGTLSDGSTEDLTNSVTWSTSNSSVATINASGFATSNGVGSATITAQAGSISNSAAMTVTAATVTNIQVTPSVVNLPAGGVQQLLATATFTDGSSQNVTSSATYSSSTPSVVTVDANGKVTAAATGSASISVSLGSSATTVPVVIANAALVSIAVTPSPLSLAVGESQQLTATGTFSDGSTQDLTNSLNWSSSASLIATVSTTGKVTVAQTGTATISGTNGSVTGSSSLTATSAVVTAIAISPSPVTLAVGQTQQFAATATMSDGSQQNVTTSVHWSTSDATKATISNSAGSNGLLSATAAGAISATATLNSITGSASVTVTSALLTSLSILPSPVSLPAGTTQAMTVTGNYTDGSTANVTSSASWTSTSAAIATVDASSILHGVSAGSTSVTATVGSVTKTDSVTVTSAVLTSIAISPGSNSVPLGLKTQLAATGTYSDGSTQDLTSQVQWSSSLPSVATVSASGLVSTLTSGSTELIATLGSVTQQAQLTVTSAVLQTISVQASQTNIALGLSVQLTAIGTYSDNSTLNITSQVTWSSLTPAVGVVSSTGVASGLTTGTFNAKATLGGVAGTLSITITSAVLQSITVTPANSIIANVLGTTVQFTATGHYSDGSAQNITTSCHWAITSGLAVGSISQTGSFSALGVGLGTLSASSGSISGSTGFTVVSVL